MDHSKWAEEQVQALIEVGVDAVDAERSVNWVLEHLPEGEDPATWVPPASTPDSIPDDQAVQDARTNWYAKDSIPPAFKRLLDAKPEEADDA